MAIRTVCQHCETRLVIRQTPVPSQVTCPKCRQPFEPVPLETSDNRSARSRTSSADKESRQRSTGAPPTRPGGTSRATDPGQRAGQTRPSPAAPVTWKPGNSSADLMRGVIQAFRGQVVHRQPTLRFRAALLGATGVLLLLVVGYFACIAGTGAGLYLYGKHVVPTTFQLRGRAAGFAMLLHLGVLAGGLSVLYALAAPLFRRRERESAPLLLTAGAHPVLHCFVHALCELIGAPEPDEIHYTPEANAWAGTRGGMLGVGGRFVLGIGGPLFLGLDLRSLAGVISHELGHFSQSGSRSLQGLIQGISSWFLEAAHRTSGISQSLTERTEGNDGWSQVLVLAMYLTTGLGRLVLWGFAFASYGTSYFLMRQMEFDADRYESQVAGSGQFARTCERLRELNVGFEETFLRILSSDYRPVNALEFATEIVSAADSLSPEDRSRVARAMAPQRAEWFDSHPSDTERIAAVARDPQPGIFQLAAPAVCLLNTQALQRGDAFSG